ncbi:hypothetical protein PFHG_03541, partial [Plasmodium falciparum HB3]
MIANIFHKNIHINKCLNINNIFFSYFNKRGILQTKFKKKNDTSYNLPFKVSRTISGNLPVYPKIRRHGTIVTTIVRHIYGDIKRTCWLYRSKRITHIKNKTMATTHWLL